MIEKVANNIPCEVAILMNEVSLWSDLTMCGSFHENWVCSFVPKPWFGMILCVSSPQVYT